VTKNTHPLDSLVARIASVHDEELASEAGSDRAEALFERIVSTHVGDRPRARRERRPRAGVRRLRSIRRVALAAAAVCALAAGLVIASETLLAPAPAAAGVEITPRDGFFVARVVDLNADPEAMRAAFRDHGLDIELRLVPVSPSLTGEIVAMSDTAEGITHLADAETDCPAETRCGPIGLRIPLDFRGQAEITLGREAGPGETYVSAGNAFAPDEALHCSGLLGVRVATARDELARRGVRVLWHVEEQIDGSQVGRIVDSPAEILDQFVVDAIPHSPGAVHIFAEETVPDSPQFKQYQVAINDGC
jgi:hypothetical protein